MIQDQLKHQTLHLQDNINYDGVAPTYVGARAIRSYARRH